MLPPLTPITDCDLDTLDALRLKRFRFTFSNVLSSAALYISGLDRTLIISGGQEIATLLRHSEELRRYSWLIAAATSIKIYSCNALIYEAETIYRERWNKLGEKARGRHMATAIQEQDLATQNVENGQETQLRPDRAKIIRSMALADIAADLEAEPDALQTFLEEQNATLIDFGGTILVPETEAVAAYEHYSLIRARQKMQERFAINSQTVTEEKPQAKATKNTAPKESKPKKPTLTWKKAFKVNKSSYKKTIENALDALFPNSQPEQTQALEGIVQGTELGKAYVDKILRAGEYTNKEQVRANLLKAAAELLSATDNALEEEQKVEAAV